MAKPERVICFRTSIADTPGALLAIAKELKSKNVALIGYSGFAAQPGEAEVFVIPTKPDKLRNLWKTAGRTFQEGSAFLVKGTDETGALITTLERLAREGINITASNAVAVGGKYGSFLWVAEGDVEKTARALGIK
jgi:prephenate dehydratase